jgi:hypothetical protein
MSFDFQPTLKGEILEFRPLRAEDFSETCPSPNKLSQLRRRLLFYLRRDRFDRELEEDMKFHLEMKAQENAEAGISITRRRRAALPLICRQ